MALQHRTSVNRGRAGAIHAVEILLILPIVLVLVLGLVEFSLILSLEQQLAVSSREGARVAAQGGSASEVEAAARRVLGAGKLNQHAVVTSLLTDVSGDPIGVEVQVPDATRVVPDLLRVIGISYKNRPLIRSAVMRRE